MFRRLALAIVVPLFALVLFTGTAQATCGASGQCFWIGGTGTLDLSTDSAHWSSTTNGSTCSCEPVSSSFLVFDACTGCSGSTVTVAIGGGTLTTGSITLSAFTGTLDFAANDNNVTTGAVANNGSGTRTLNLGDGTWTLTSGTNPWSQAGATNLTFNANASTLSFTAVSGARSITFATSNSVNAITIGAGVNGATFGSSAAFTVATLTITAPNAVAFPSSVTTTVTNALTVTGSTPGNVLLFAASPSTVATISSANNGTFTWTGFRGLTFSGGGTFTATNSTDYGANTNITITAPTFGSGSGGGIIGG